MLPTDPRRERVLDAAAPLFLRLGYTHASTNAIAVRAGVSKATIYAYWPDKAALFNALVVRESFRVLDAWEAGIAEDPRGGTIGRIIAHGFRALSASPLLQALYTRDQTALGDLFRLRGLAHYSERYLANLDFVRALQQARVIRDDLPAETVNHLLEALSLGFVTVGELVDAALLPRLDAVGETLAVALQGALAPSDPAPSDEGKRAVRDYFARLRTLANASTTSARSETPHDQEHDHGND